MLDSDFNSFDVKRTFKSTSHEVKPKYKNKLPISVKKKKDLLALCKSLTIPEDYHDYYTNLRTDAKATDRCEFPDVLEDDQEETM